MSVDWCLSFCSYLLILTSINKLMITDKALNGGIPLQGITEISGEAGSGKTQFCLMLALQVRQIFYFFLILF